MAEPADVSIIVRDGSPEPVCTVQVALKFGRLASVAGPSSACRAAEPSCKEETVFGLNRA